MSLQKRKPIRSKAIRQAAKDEPCTLCGTNDGTTVFCHLNEGWAGKCMGQKADDLGGGFFACYSCHLKYDKNSGDIDPAMVLRSVYRTLVRLYELGIIRISNEKTKTVKEKMS